MDKITKVCVRCRTLGRPYEKLLEEFPPLKTMKDGRGSWCRVCKAEAQAEYRERDSIGKPRPKPKNNRRLPRRQYLAWIYKYTQRREELKQKLGADSEEYKREAMRIRSKISNWSTAVRRIDRRSKKIRDIDALIQEFFGISAYQISPKKSKQAMLAKRVFCKYAMELGIQGSFLERFTGMARAEASKHRRAFSRSFDKNMENKVTWYRFKEFVRHHNTDQQTLKRA